ncbi:MAG: hypothetical protein IBX55_00830 [Methyloprofundus sp.]|nr:hypothetical protein [Methyloprofundus sp.]
MDIESNKQLMDFIKASAVELLVDEEMAPSTKERADLFDQIMDLETADLARLPLREGLAESFPPDGLFQLKNTLLSEVEGKIEFAQQLFDQVIPQNIDVSKGWYDQLIVEHSLDDMTSDESNKTRARTEISHQGVSLGAEGYGDYTGDGIDSKPILIEKADGEVRVAVWSDINNEEPTDIIELNKARLELRDGYEEEQIEIYRGELRDELNQNNEVLK